MPLFPNCRVRNSSQLGHILPSSMNDSPFTTTRFMDLASRDQLKLIIVIKNQPRWECDMLLLKIRYTFYPTHLSHHQQPVPVIKGFGGRESWVFLVNQKLSRNKKATWKLSPHQLNPKKAHQKWNQPCTTQPLAIRDANVNHKKGTKSMLYLLVFFHRILRNLL